MDKNIQTILEDLYRVDARLKKHEKDLVAVIEKLLQSQPDAPLDKVFAARLRRELLRAGETEGEGKLSASSFSYFINTMQYTFTKPLAYASVGVAAVVLAIIAARFTPAGINAPSMAQLAFQTRITPVAERAFGSLAMSTAVATGRGGGGGGSATSMSADAALGLGGGGGVSEKMIVPADMTNYRYVYKGDEFTIDQTTMAVLRRVKGAVASDDLKDYLSQLNFGALNLNALSGLQLQNMTLAENKDFGMTLYVSPLDGMLSLSENWPKWQSVMPKCRDEACYQQTRLQPSDVLPDEELVRLANDFVKQYGIDLTNYGTPRVDSRWRVMYEREPDKQYAYIPDVVTVQYPLVVEGKQVYEEGGEFFGMGVNINLRAKRASGMWNYTTQSYESSQYEVEQDVQRILKVAERGGRYYQPFYTGQNVKTTNVELGTPTMSFVKIWKYDENSGQSDELLVPALIFPVTKAPQTRDFYRTNVVVPLTKETIAEFEQNSGGPITIMPAEPASTEEPVKSEDASATDSTSAAPAVR